MRDLDKRIANLSPEKRALLEMRLMQKGMVGDKLELIPRRNTSEACPLSFAQQRLWFLNQLEPDSSVYNISSAFRLSGVLKISALERSIDEIIRRHESLRTTFAAVDGQPIQIIGESARYKQPLVDLSGLQEKDRLSEIHRLATAEARGPFDLAQGPLFRVKLLKVDEEDHVLLLTMHHIITDGWSMGVFFKELSTLYGAFSNGNSSPLPSLPIQYTDFAVWQQQWLQGDVLEAQLNYWKKQLDGASPTLELPADRSRSPIQTYRGDRHAFMLPKSLTEGLKILSAEEEATLFMTLMATFQTLLYRYTGQENISVGSPIANRNRTEIEGLIGFFVNTLVLRTDLSGDPSFRKLLNRVREAALGAYANQDFPFEKLVEQLQPERDLSRSPLFQVMFGLQNVPRRPLELSGLKVSPFEQKNDTAKFDLTLFLWEIEDGIKGSIEYCTDLFDSARIVRMIEHYRTLLEGVVANPDQSVSRLPLLTRAEQHQLLVDWNNTQLDYPKDKCIHELFEDQVIQTPDAIAVADKNEQITYQELNTRSNQLAHYLKELGVGPQVVVGLCTKRSIEMVIGIMGILKAGGIYLPLDPSYPEQRLSFMLEDSRALILLSDENSRSVLPKGKTRIVNIDSNDGIFTRQSPENPTSNVTAATPAYLIYTSGSTGTPKGVLGLQRGVVNRFNWMWQAYPFEAEEVCCQKTSISFVDSIWEILGPLLQGIKTVIVSDEVVKDPRQFVKYLAEEQVTRIIAVPSYLRVILDVYSDLQKRLPRLKFWISSGEILSKELYQRFCEKLPQCLLLNLYGSSEVSADVTCFDTNSMNGVHFSVPIGRPIANTQVYILDSGLQPVPVGVPGELYIGGDNLAAGYLNLGKMTENAFIPNPFSDRPSTRIFKTGDRGRWQPDGNIEFIGRVDHQVKIRGFRIELGEVEVVLNKHPSVKECVVVAREDRPNEQRLIAYIVLRRKSKTATQEFQQLLKKRLPDYMLPSEFVMLDKLPVTTSGKVDRNALPAPDRSRRRPTDAPVAPRDELELQLTKTWEKVLRVQPIGRNDNFFELGGHSLLVVRLITQIEEILSTDLPFATLFQAPTVAQLAKILRDQGWSAPLSSLEAIETGGARVGGIGANTTKQIPTKSNSYFKQQYLKLKQQPGYLYLKRHYFRAKNSITKRLLSYRPSQLEEKFRAMGLAESDTVYMHSAFKPFNGFSGGPHQIIDCLLNVIGDAGNLVMVSMPYGGSTETYLRTAKVFDVIKTESSMGIITEIFRRKKDVLRSLNPAHPILAFGPDAQWIISGHDKTMYSCGKGSPFEKISQLDAKAFFFDVPFRTMTFFHYLEDKFKDSSPVKLYDDEALESIVIDSKGNEIRVKTHIFSKAARENRSARHIARELRMKNLIRIDRIGNTKLNLVNLRDVVGCAQKIVDAGLHFYNV